MKLSIDINVRLSADDGLTRLLTELLAARTAPAAPAPTFLPTIPDSPKAEQQLSERQTARMLDPEPVAPTPIPDILRNTTLHPVTQEALAALRDPMVTGRAIDAVAERDRRVLGDRPVTVAELVPDALAKPTRTIKTPEPIAKPPRKAAVFAAEDAPTPKVILKGTVVSSRREVVDGVDTLMQTIRCSCGTEYERAFKAGRVPRCEACR